MHALAYYITLDILEEQTQPCVCTRREPELGRRAFLLILNMNA